MIILSNGISEKTDEGSLKVVNSLISRLKKQDEDTVVISYGSETEQSDMHLSLNKLLFSPKLRRIIKEKNMPVLYIPQPSKMLSAGIRTFVLSRYAKKGLRALYIMQFPMSRLGGMFIKLSGAEIVTLSKSSYDRYYALIGNRAKYIKTGVDTEKFSPVDIDTKRQLREKYGVADGKRVILHVGHLKEGRNIRQLLRVSDDYHVFLVVSTQTEAERDASLRSELEAKGNITIIDSYISNIEELYRMSDVYFFPVKEAVNCIDVPLSVLEAAACNIPVVTTSYGELSELQGKDGFWFIDDFNSDMLNEILNEAASFKGDVRSAVMEYEWNNALLMLNKPTI